MAIDVQPIIFPKNRVSSKIDGAAKICTAKVKPSLKLAIMGEVGYDGYYQQWRSVI